MLPDDIRTLVATSFSEADARVHEAYTLSVDDKAALAATGKEILQHFPMMAGACMAMSALHSVILEKRVKQRAYVAVGSLYVGNVRVFGDDNPVDGSQFNQSSTSWDGHAWVVLGDYIADASLFRTARLGMGHPALGVYVAREFRNAGMMVSKSGDTHLSGLRYEAHYILTQTQVDAIARGTGKLMGVL